MPLEDPEVKRLIIDLLKNPGERDLQKLIGASEIGNPCDFCVGNRLLQTPKAKSKYWLGTKIGTAIHRELEYEEAKHIEKPENYRFTELAGAKIEESITLGSIEGYGTVRSKPDLVLVRARHLLDHKTTSKKKVQHYKLDGIPKQYYYQQQLYAWGLNNSGVPIERISLNFINREGLTDDDVWIYSFPYEEGAALAAWDRLNLIWQYLQAGNDVDTLQSDPHCYYCTQVLQRI